MRKFLLATCVFACLVHAAEAASCASPQFAWNPSDKGAGVTLSTTTYTNDTAQSTTPAGGPGVRSTPVIPSGKWYWEQKATTDAAQCPSWIGGTGDSSAPLAYAGSTHYAQMGGQTAASSAVALYGSNTATICAGTGSSCSGMNITSGSWYGIAVDIPNQHIWFTPGTGWCGTTFSTNPLIVNPVGNIAGYTTSGMSNYYTIWYGGAAADKNQLNDGSSNFQFSIPVGFGALCTSTLPTGRPTVEILARNNHNP